MTTLPQLIPDVQTLLALEPEELAGKLLVLLRSPTDLRQKDMFSMAGVLAECFSRHGQGPEYPSHQKKAVYSALAEAWGWLEAQGLLIPADESNGRNGWRALSRRAKRLESEQDFSKFVAARYLPQESLHTSIRSVVWSAFVRSEYDVAVFQAMKMVEVKVRNAGDFSDNLLGVRLMRAAFAPRTGLLSDIDADEGEQVARMELFAGAIGSYKNPHSHRDVQLDDPAEAIEIVQLANHLLRIVDARLLKMAR